MGGVALIAASTIVLLISATWVRRRAAALVADVSVAISAAGIALGGLMLLDDVSTNAWIVAPSALGVAAVLHVRALFAGAGPFRT
jgi:hypothetical protein